jgi:hypothetical protein
MPMDPSILAMFTHDVTVNMITGTDAYGRDTVTASTSHKARLVDRFRTQYSRQGEVLRFEGVAWLAPDDNGNMPTIVPGQTTISLPNGQEQRILSYQKFDDPEANMDHVKVFYGTAGAI